MQRVLTGAPQKCGCTGGIDEGPGGTGTRILVRVCLRDVVGHVLDPNFVSYRVLSK
jgi:hypothetical protein